MRELLGLAAQGIEVPDDPVVDDIMRKADRIRRRRRIMLAAGSAAAVVAVGVGTALLPQPGVGAPRGDIAGSAPATPPGTEPATSAPPPTAEPTGSATSSAPGNRPRPSSPAPPSSSAATSPTRTATTTPTTRAPSTSAPTKSSGGPTMSAAAGKGALEFVKSKLPSGIGTVTKEADTATPSYTRNPLSGRYLVTKNGRMGWIDITVYDPKVNPDQPRQTVEQVAAHNYCADNGVTAPNTNCASNGETDGGIFKTWRGPGNQQEPGAGHVSGPSYHALLYYPDGRGLEITAAAGVTGSDAYPPAMDAPPITAAQLTELIGGSGWFRA
ncbi:hypothetical protein [Yinghuangia sp. YIM S09857]|uniref:hypothetical protein n=1 Tax=Yinghuangia sp. YIM S09857 TaxID=3436929 RepID=UPI003F5355B5